VSKGDCKKLGLPDSALAELRCLTKTTRNGYVMKLYLKSQARDTPY